MRYSTVQEPAPAFTLKGTDVRRGMSISPRQPGPFVPSVPWGSQTRRILPLPTPPPGGTQRGAPALSQPSPAPASKPRCFPALALHRGTAGRASGSAGGGLRAAAGTSAGSRAAPSRGKRSLRTRPAEPRKNPREGCLDFLLAFVSLQTWGSDTAEVTPRPTCVLPTIASYDVFCLQLMKNV